MFFDQASAAEVRAAADPSDAGSHWRREKLKDLVWRAKCLHVHDRPEFAEAIEQLKALTAQVEAVGGALAAGRVLARVPSDSLSTRSLTMVLPISISERSLKW